jgi:hypothetical protein
MVYSTVGFSLARLSVVDGAGREVYDALVRPDAGIAVMCVRARPSPRARALTRRQRPQHRASSRTRSPVRRAP